VPDVSPALKARDYKGPSSDGDGDGDGDGASLVPIAFHPTQDPISSQDGLVHALGTGSSGGCATAAVAFTHSGYSNKPAWITGDRTDCLPSSGHGDSSHQGIGVMQPLAVRTAQTSANGHGIANDVAHTLDQVQGQAVAFNAYQRTEQDAAWPLGASDGRKVEVGVQEGMAVRRLTPRECERLQGFPDDYTAIEYRKKPAADGPRYKALGNSMAVPVMAWIGQRIAAAARK
jgi:DNA (cytosine-5)-methyltransferase 1